MNKIPYKITQHYETLAKKYRQNHNREQQKKHNIMLLKRMINKNN